MRKLFLSLLCLCMMITLVGCGKNTSKNNSNNKKNNDIQQTDTEVNEAVALDSQVVNGLTFDHFAITKDSNNLSVVYFDITNKTDSSINVGSVTFILYEKGSEVLKLKERINTTLEPGQSKSVVENFDISMPNVDEVKYIVE